MQIPWSGTFQVGSPLHLLIQYIVDASLEALATPNRLLTEIHLSRKFFYICLLILQ